MRPNWLKIDDPADPEYDANAPRYWAPWDGPLNGSEIGPEGHNDPSLYGTFVEDLSADATKYPSGRRYVWRPLLVLIALLLSCAVTWAQATATPAPTATATPQHVRDGDLADGLLCPSPPCVTAAFKAQRGTHTFAVDNASGIATVDVMCRVRGDASAWQPVDVSLATLSVGIGTAAHTFSDACDLAWGKVTTCAPAPTPTGTPAAAGTPCSLNAVQNSWMPAQ